MSVVFQGDGTKTSSVSITSKTLRDTAPASLFLRSQPNLVEVASDAGISYVYRRGVDVDFLPLAWRNVPYVETEGTVLHLLELWHVLKGGLHWCWLQPSHLTSKSTYTCLTTGTGVSFPDTDVPVHSSSNPLLGRLWGVWMTATVGANVGKKFRVVNSFSGQELELDRPFDTTNGDTFILGYPVRFVSDLPFVRKGNRNDRYDIDLLCKVVLF